MKEFSQKILNNYDVNVSTNGEKVYTLKVGNNYDDARTSFLTSLSLTTDRVCNASGNAGCLCDKLLRQFHRYDESLSWQGKWGGGSAGAVCRGWGTSNVSRSVSVAIAIYVLVFHLTFVCLSVQ